MFLIPTRPSSCDVAKENNKPRGASPGRARGPGTQWAEDRTMFQETEPAS